MFPPYANKLLTYLLFIIIIINFLFVAAIIIIIIIIEQIWKKLPPSSQQMICHVRVVYARKVDMGDDVSTKWRDNACPAPVGGVIHLSRQETRILTVLIKRQVGMKVVLATTYDVSTNSSVSR